MARITVDFSLAPSQEAIAVGDHPVIVEKVELRDSKSSSNQYLNWDLVCTEGESTGRHLFMMTSFSPKALWRLQAVMEALGFDDTDVLDIETDDDTKLVIDPELVGKVAIARVKHEVYDGKVQSRVDELLPIHEGPSTGRTVPLKASSNGEAPGQQESFLKSDEKKPRLALR